MVEEENLSNRKSYLQTNEDKRVTILNCNQDSLEHFQRQVWKVRVSSLFCFQLDTQSK